MYFVNMALRAAPQSHKPGMGVDGIVPLKKYCVKQPILCKVGNVANEDSFISWQYFSYKLLASANGG